MKTTNPLRWPLGTPRTPSRHKESSRFKLTLSKASEELREELSRLGGSEIELTTDLLINTFGLPYAKQPQNVDAGVALYFKRKGISHVFACDVYPTPAANVRAIGLTITAIRAIERYGVSQALDHALRGFALPEHATTSGVDAGHWSMVLGVPLDATPEQVKRAHHKLIYSAHSDTGGSHEQAIRLNAARDAYQREKGQAT